MNNMPQNLNVLFWAEAGDRCVCRVGSGPKRGNLH